MNIHYRQILLSPEILPVVEFVLEEGVTDEEAVRLIQQSGGGNAGDLEDPSNEKEEEEDSRWKQTQSGSAQALTLDSSPTHGTSTEDPFTANLMSFFVSFLLMWHNMRNIASTFIL